MRDWKDSVERPVLYLMMFGFLMAHQGVIPATWAWNGLAVVAYGYALGIVGRLFLAATHLISWSISRRLAA